VEVNLDHVRDLKRTHQQKYPEKYQKALEKYRNQHREKINIKARDRRQQNLEHHRESGRRSRDKHVEARNAYQRAYGKRNRDKLTLFTNRRRARKLSALGNHTEAEWEELKTFYNYTCLSCGKSEPEIRLTRDHVLPLVLGGNDSIDNIQPLCARCNSKKSSKHIDYR
jgi:5-methylcytosine-specific restriction endonuclease McrA